MQLCPYCEKGELHTFTDSETIMHGGKQLLVPGVLLSRCDACGEEMATPEQAKVNQRLFADAKRSADGLMSSDQIRNWRKSLGWSQAQAVTLLGGGANAFSKYERGEVVQSRQMDLLMRLLAHSPEAREVLPRIVAGDLQCVGAVRVRLEDLMCIDAGDLAWSPIRTLEATAAALYRWDDAAPRSVRSANDDRYDWSQQHMAIAL
ncbi:type II toxin-antitoxin system MqsA family antitoxin [Stenotrophomonas maltophilia]|nr:type II toxin-antitoxin system MqsA family antitoxin [Stenotrophomonas maltophilia]